MADTTTTKALVVRSPGAGMKLETIKLDSIRPDEALIEIHYTGVCHTDIKAASGKFMIGPPMVPGHEGAGVILEAGSDLQSEFHPGDKVLLSYAFCGSCPHCSANDPAYCDDIRAMNFSGVRSSDGISALSYSSESGDGDGDGDDGEKLKGHFFGQSSFAHRAIVHRSSLVKVPASTPLSVFAPLGCGLQTGAGAVMNVLDVQPGSTLAVFGVGAVGLSAIMAGKIRGAKKIVAVDLVAERLALAKEMGATDVVDGADEDVVKQIVGLCPPYGVQYAVDCSGVPKVIETMVDSLGTRGHGVTVGSPGPGPRAAIDIASHLIRGRKYSGTHQGESRAKEMIPYLVEQHKQGKYPLERMMTVYEYTNYEKAFDDLKTGKAVKAVLKWK